MLKKFWVLFEFPHLGVDFVPNFEVFFEFPHLGADSMFGLMLIQFPHLGVDSTKNLRKVEI